MVPMFEIKEEEEIRPVKNEEEKPVENKGFDDSVKIEFIGKDADLNDYIVDWKGKNLIKTVFSDDTYFITSEDSFKKLEKKLGLKNVQFNINVEADGKNTSVPSFILEKAGISKGDKIVFEISENGSLRLKKVD